MLEQAPQGMVPVAQVQGAFGECSQAHAGVIGVFLSQGLDLMILVVILQYYAIFDVLKMHANNTGRFF